MIREIFTYLGPVLRVTVLPASVPISPFHRTGIQALIQFEHAISATALIRSNGMKLGGREIHTRAFGIGSHIRNDSPFETTMSRTTPTPKPRWEFNPFSPEYITPLAERSTQLNATSRPFVPSSSSSSCHRGPQQKSSSPVSGLNSSKTDSEASKVSVRMTEKTASSHTLGEDVSEVKENILLGRWQKPAAWCEFDIFID
jgi:hypothetical protein